MRQIICDQCDKPIDRDEFGDGQYVRVAVVTGLATPLTDGPVREYHRRCARILMVKDVWMQAGLLPL